MPFRSNARQNGIAHEHEHGFLGFRPQSPLRGDEMRLWLSPSSTAYA